MPHYNSSHRASFNEACRVARIGPPRDFGAPDGLIQLRDIFSHSESFSTKMRKESLLPIPIHRMPGLKRDAASVVAQSSRATRALVESFMKTVSERHSVSFFRIVSPM